LRRSSGLRELRLAEEVLSPIARAHWLTARLRPRGR
jgi:hypothetical protein